MSIACAVLSAGCNAIFGTDSVTALPSSDAQFFDAALDAPPACAAGTPAFRSDLYDVETTGTCTSYSVAENGRILAVCTTAGKIVLETGTVVIGLPTAGPLVVVVHDLPSGSVPLTVRLAPEGDFAIMHVYDGTDAVHALQLVGASWHDLGTIPGLNGAHYFSPPTRGPQRHLIEYVGSAIVEHIGDGLTWTTPAPYTPEGLETMAGDFGLTPDGLRLVAVGTSKLDALPLPRYAERSDIASPFTVSTPLAQPAAITQLMLTEDCDALFFVGLERVLYVKQ